MPFRITPQLQSPSRPVATIIRPVSAAIAAFDRIQIEVFRKEAFSPQRPYVLQGNPLPSYPAVVKWFNGSNGDKDLNSMYLGRYSISCMLDYELSLTKKSWTGIEEFLKWVPSQRTHELAIVQSLLAAVVGSSNLNDRSGATHDFIRFRAPLSLLLQVDAFNVSGGGMLGRRSAVSGLYVAQNAIADLPAQLQEDFPVPNLVRTTTDRGDIYGSNIWLGIEPTYTPLHRDPNHNFFVQISGAKTVRLMDPVSGEALYRTARITAGNHGGSSRIRYEDMMQEPERSILMGAVWGDAAESTSFEHRYFGQDIKIFEAKVSTGDAIFIPLGWWHSIQSRHHDGRINASVNWWFR